MRRPVGIPLAASLVLALSPGFSAAQVTTITVNNVDDPNEGFNDPTPATVVGGNSGMTIGEQRRTAVQHAANLWAAALVSMVEIVVDARFDDLPCVIEGAVLGQANPLSLSSLPGNPSANPDWLYVGALANRLEQVDIAPGEADLEIAFNSLEHASCASGATWYYGLDGQPGDGADLVEVALHELAHGLGISMFVDPNTGALPGPGPDSMTAQALDLQAGLHLGDMDDAGRRAALGRVRQVVWDGDQVKGVAATMLTPGTPTLTTTPAVPGLSGLVSDTDFGAPPLSRSASGSLAIGDPIDGRSVGPGDLSGQVLLYRPVVSVDSLAAAIGQLGAVALLFAVDDGYLSPPQPLERPGAVPSGLPILRITEADADALQAAVAMGTVTAHISEDADQRLGTDPEGRVFLNATEPISASTLSHWDLLPRPNLLMEPHLGPRPSLHGLDLALAWLHDIGWTTCGNGEIETGEGCDDGDDNSDHTSNACRRHCQPARCGDGVIDSGEGCDNAAGNHDTRANACRTDCSAARCGDRVRDAQEACDDGDANSDAVADACRGDCSAPRCGDGVTDAQEGCDDGDANSDDAPDSCRLDCSVARCGDGVRDAREHCDKGSASVTCDAAECDDAGSDSDCIMGSEDGWCELPVRDAGCPGGTCDAGQPDAGQPSLVAPPRPCDGGPCRHPDSREVTVVPDRGCGCRLVSSQTHPAMPAGFGLVLGLAWMRRAAARRRS